MSALGRLSSISFLFSISDLSSPSVCLYSLMKLAFCLANPSFCFARSYIFRSIGVLISLSISSSVWNLVSITTAFSYSEALMWLLIFSVLISSAWLFSIKSRLICLALFSALVLVVERCSFIFPIVSFCYSFQEPSCVLRLVISAPIRLSKAALNWSWVTRPPPDLWASAAYLRLSDIGEIHRFCQAG